jgi:hypothetical protein
MGSNSQTLAYGLMALLPYCCTAGCLTHSVAHCVRWGLDAIILVVLME